MQGPTLGLGRVMEFTPTTARAVDDSCGADARPQKCVPGTAFPEVPWTQGQSPA